MVGLPYVPLNALLTGLPEDESSRIEPLLRPVTFAAGAEIQRPAFPLVDVYFPAVGLIGLLNDVSDGSTCAIAMVGRHGFVGASIVSGNRIAQHRAVAQTETRGTLISAVSISHALRDNTVFRRRAERYAQILMNHVAQSAFCYRHHSIESQFCRYMLAHEGCSGLPDIVTSQSSIAEVLGVRRESITLAASALKEEGAIGVSRGRIRLLNRKLVEAKVCDCHSKLNEMYLSPMPA